MISQKESRVPEGGFLVVSRHIHPCSFLTQLPCAGLCASRPTTALGCPLSPRKAPRESWSYLERTLLYLAWGPHD